MAELIKTSPRYAGLFIIAAGIALFVIRAIYDLAARTSLAAKEYKALMESGLISDLYEENSDKTLINMVDLMQEPPPSSYATAPLKASGRSEAFFKGSDEYRTAPLGPGRAKGDKI